MVAWLTLTLDIFKGRSEHVEEFLNPTYTSSMEEAECEDSGTVSSISVVEVAEIVKKFMWMRFERLKVLTLLDSVLSVVWGTRTVLPVDVVFKKKDLRVCSNHRDIALLSLPGKV